MVPRTVLTSSGSILLNTARPVNTAQPRTAVNNAGHIKNVINNAYSSVRRPINNITSSKNNKINQKVNTVRAKKVNTARPKASNPQQDLKDKGVINNRCSRHMTGNISYLIDYEEIDGVFVSIGGTKFNLFNVSQICDKKNSVLFTDTACVVLPPDFKLTDKSHVLLKVPRKDNMYSVDLKNVVPQGGRKLALSFMRPFGCPITILNTIDHLGKFDGNADEGFFIGYSTNNKAFRVFNSRTRIVEENMHVKFGENTHNIEGSGPNWLFDIDALTKSMNYKPVIIGNQSNGSATTKACDNDSPSAGFKPSMEEKKKDDEDLGNEDNDVPSIEGPRVNQVKNANVNNTNNINTVSPTDNAAGIEDNTVDENIVYGCADDLNMPDLEEIGLSLFATWKKSYWYQWVFRNKKDERGIVVRNKARLVAQGHTQEEGIDYEEVFAPVARIEAIRLFLAYVSFMSFMVYQMDVKRAFLYGTIEEELMITRSTIYLREIMRALQLVKLVIDPRERIAVLDGQLVQLPWDGCNVVVLSWILGSLPQDVCLGHVFSDNVAIV
nr:hypothetical protein [Tanacetum cinerariifolium]